MVIKTRSTARAVAAAAIVAGVGVSGVGVSAQAAPNPRAYDVTADAPRESRGEVAYRFEVEGPRRGGGVVEVQHRVYEQDRGRDDQVGPVRRYEHDFDRDRDRDWSETRRTRVPDTERGAEEVYHVVRWRVVDDDGDASRWQEEVSPVRSVGR